MIEEKPVLFSISEKDESLLVQILSGEISETGKTLLKEYVIDWLAYRFAALRPVLRPPSLTLVKDGRIVEEAMRKEMLSMDELASLLRQQQVEDIAAVRLAKLEGDGRISVLRREAPSPGTPPS